MEREPFLVWLFKKTRVLADGGKYECYKCGDVIELPPRGAWPHCAADGPEAHGWAPYEEFPYVHESGLEFLVPAGWVGPILELLDFSCLLDKRFSTWQYHLTAICNDYVETAEEVPETVRVLDSAENALDRARAEIVRLVNILNKETGKRAWTVKKLKTRFPVEIEKVFISLGAQDDPRTIAGFLGQFRDTFCVVGHAHSTAVWSLVEDEIEEGHKAHEDQFARFTGGR